MWYDAPDIYLDMVKRLQSQDRKVKDIVQKVLQNGAYCTHPETLLQRLLVSEDEEERRFLIFEIFLCVINVMLKLVEQKTKLFHSFIKPDFFK